MPRPAARAAHWWQAEEVAHAGARPNLPALLRAKQALAAAGLDGDVDLVPVPHASNEVWFAGEHVLRVATGSREGRLAVEARVAAALPAAVPRARVVAHGKAALGEWLVMDRVPGRPLSEAWPQLGAPERRDAVRQLARALRALHAVRPSVELLAYAHAETPHPLPASRVVELLAEARRVDGVGTNVIDGLLRLVAEIGDALDPTEVIAGLVHGDLVLDNVLWHAGRLTALLDLEWVRPGPPDLDLDVLLQYCAAPELSTAAADREALGAEDLRDVPGWLREDYPELFEHPRLDDRLLLYRISYDVCALLRHPTQIGLAHHPYARLCALVAPR